MKAGIDGLLLKMLADWLGSMQIEKSPMNAVMFLIKWT